MLHDAMPVRTAFDRLGRAYIDFARNLSTEDLLGPGLGEWSVRELLGHALRAFSTVAAYLDAPPTTGRRLTRASDYYAAILTTPAVHEGVAERGRLAGVELGEHPADVVDATITAACARVVAASVDADVSTVVGQMALEPYLGTRIVEAGVHLLDLQRAVRMDVGLDPLSAEIVLHVLSERVEPTELILALTGRIDLPSGYNVLR